MRKPILIIAALMLLVMPMMAEKVTPETARKVATTFLQNNGAKTAQMTELSQKAGFHNLYIFTTESSFVVMSADDCVLPILGYSFNGKFVAEGLPANLRDWLQGYNEQIQYAIDNLTKASAETERQWADLESGKPNAAKTTVVVSPLIQTHWDQGWPYNNLCPSGCPTGCVATAMAQVMKYWNYPEHGVGSNSYTPSSHPEYGTQSADFNSTNYDWDNMTNTYSSSSTSTQQTAVATLMYHCGVSVEMDYNPSSSGAVTAYVADALKTYFNYSSETQHLSRSSYSDDDWIAMLKSELDLHRPIQYHGNGSGGGHSFVCDGYNSDNYFHFNWGWGGYCDDYYLIDNLNPGPGGIGSGSNGIYNDSQGAIFGVHPSSNNASPTDLNYSVTGLQTCTLSWSVATGVASYNIYRNGALVGNTETTTFTEAAPFGTNVYWVRSVDANGELSLSSNTVTVTIAYQMPVVNDLTATLSNNDAVLTWTEPEWCYPETPSSTLTYGSQVSSGTYYPFGTWSVYWGQRHLSENITAYDGLRLYSVDFYAFNPGSYELCIYEGTHTNGSYTVPTTLVYNQPASSASLGWNTIDLATPCIIDGNNDLWVFIHNTQTFDDLRVFLCSAEGAEGVYYSQNPTSYTYNNASGYAFMIKTYLTDGTYTYNLYQDGTAIVENLNSTTYNATLNDNAANLFTVKTNYYAGETDASNKVGFAKGSASMNGWEMASNDKMTLTEGSSLTVSGNLVNSNTDNLILENDAQLIHNTEGLKATVKKSITPYTGDNNGWNFIASPITENLTPSEENGFLNGAVEEGNNTYDLYYYYEPEYLWMNYETETFNLVHKQGYLYANGQDGGTTLHFTGTLIPSNNSVTIDNLSHSATLLNGFNLVGNPFACNATVDRDFYVIDNTTNKVVLAQSNAVIAPCEGVFVQASTDNTSVTFSKANAAKSNPAKEGFDIVVTQGKANVDRARVRMGEGAGMEKFCLDDKHTQISLWQDGKYYAVAYTNGAKELPLNFKATKDGTYTLAIEAENLNLAYLHLIDNLTGEDTDLLATPNYTFETKTTDYASRFKLVFSNCEDAVGDNDVFAYLSNGSIFVNQEDNATLQIVDATGRLVASYNGRIQCIPTNGMVSGVYVLRLITDNGMKTQKLIIE